MLYIFKKGWHYSVPLFKCKLDFIGEYSAQSASVSMRFNKTNKYIFNDNDQTDGNKLFGYSQGYHHKNSCRVTWYWDPEQNNVKLCYYAYENGKRLSDGLFAPICNVPIDTDIDIELSTMRLDNLRVEDLVKVKIGDEVIGEHRHVRVLKSKILRLGYYMTPYFGGNKKCPHDMYIEMHWK